MTAAVVLVASQNSTNRCFGTGFVIGEQEGESLVVTCAHVINDVGGPGQILADGQMAVLVACGGTDDGNIDLAVLRTPGVREQFTLRLTPSVQPGEEFSAEGFLPFGGPLLLREIHGVLRQEVYLAFRGRAERIKAWDLRVIGEYGLKPGYSGAPVVDGQGEVVGIVSYRLGEETGLAISIEALPALWPEMPRSLLGGAPSLVTHLVSNGEYLGFVQDSGHRRSHHWSATAPFFADDQAGQPVTRVSWDDATAYCDWRGGALPLGQASRASAPAGIGEWRDGGTEDDKEIRDPVSSSLLGTLRRDTRSPDVGFRCVPARPAPHARWAMLDGGRFELGIDARRFAALADRYRVPVARRQQVLARQARICELPDFKISETCVTNEEYYAFTQTGRTWPSHWSAKWLSLSGRPFPARLAGRPVVNVTAKDARLYCIWSQVRLPTWQEWERAVAGAGRLPYSWGERYDRDLCNGSDGCRGSLAAVDEYPAGASAENVLQLCGNVAEWVSGPNGGYETRGGSYRMPGEIWGLASAFRPERDDHCAPDVGLRVVTD